MLRSNRMDPKSKLRGPIVVNGVHFIWVPAYQEAIYANHWLSINGKLQTRVIEDIGPGSRKWGIDCCAFGILPDTTMNEKTLNKDKFPEAIKRIDGITDENKALVLAAQFALNGV